MKDDRNPDSVNYPPFETEDLRKNLAAFLKHPFEHDTLEPEKRVGTYKCGVYAFFDYDGEPIYVGQTKENLGTRIRRHLTNQRTDAVAMSVLDPFEVYEIQAWPLPQFEDPKADEVLVKQTLDALEHLIYQKLLSQSQFCAVLNEKDPPSPEIEIEEPNSVSGCVVSEKVRKIRSHPDFRIARRALTISRLAQVISERKVKPGLRRVLLTQAKRLQWLAERRFEGLGLGGATSISEDEQD